MASKSRINISRSKAVAINNKDIQKNNSPKPTKETKKVMEKETSEISELRTQMDVLQQENDRLKRRQEAKAGASFETLDRVKYELDKTRSTNRFLLENIETRKAQVSDAQTQSFEMQMKMESMARELEDNIKENEKLKAKVISLHNKQMKMKKVAEENNVMKGYLFNHKIDYKTGKFIGIKIHKQPKNVIQETEVQQNPKVETSVHENKQSSPRALNGSYMDIHKAKLTQHQHKSS